MNNKIVVTKLGGKFPIPDPYINLSQNSNPDPYNLLKMENWMKKWYVQILHIPLNMEH